MSSLSNSIPSQVASAFADVEALAIQFASAAKTHGDAAAVEVSGQALALVNNAIAKLNEHFDSASTPERH